MIRRRASPCIGICSTTYGDLVCRGCNRFAHEVVQWNGYSEAQHDVIWRRLDELRDGAVHSVLSESQVEALCATQNRTADAHRSAAGNTSFAYEVVRRLAVGRLPLPWEAEANSSRAGESSSARQLLVDIDREIHERSLAIYERSFKIPAE